VKAAEGEAVVDQQVTIGQIKMVKEASKLCPNDLPALRLTSAWLGRWVGGASPLGKSRSVVHA